VSQHIGDEMKQELGAEHAEEVAAVLRDFANALTIYFDQDSAAHILVPVDDKGIRVKRVDLKIFVECQDISYVLDRGGDF